MFNQLFTIFMHTTRNSSWFYLLRSG